MPKLSDWGNNPGTWQAIGAAVSAVGLLGLIASLLLAWRSVRETRAQRLTAEREIGDRMRPWIGVYEASCRVGLDYEADIGTLSINAKNAGPLPALAVHMQGVLTAEREDGESRPEADLTYIWHEYAERKAIMPSEDGNYTVELGPVPFFARSLKTRRNVEFQGRIDYQSGSRKFYSTFQIILRLDSFSSDMGQEVPLYWHNEELV